MQTPCRTYLVYVGRVFLWENEKSIAVGRKSAMLGVYRLKRMEIGNKSVIKRGKDGGGSKSI